MQKNCKAMVLAMETKGNAKVGNDQVVTRGDVSTWTYHGHVIAEFYHDTPELYLIDAGWRTPTTKLRLNAAALWLAEDTFKLWQEDFTWWWTTNGYPELWSGDLLLDGKDMT